MLLLGTLLVFLLAILFVYLLSRGPHIPSNIYIPMDSYICTPNNGFSVCSGNGYDEYGNQWTIVDKAYYQVRSSTDTRRILNMTLTNGSTVYLLDGSGQGEDNPIPTDDPSFTFAVTNHPGLNARLSFQDDVYVVTFFAST